MDMANGILRPEFKHRMTELEESVSTDSARTAAGYQKTGDLITLPYTEVEMVNQPYASRIENVNPFNVIAWVGSIALDPASDIWKDTNRLPNLVINREGNYDSFIARNGGSAVNTVWNEWETFWTGENQTLYNGEIVHGQQLENNFLSVGLWKEQLQPQHPNNHVLVFVLKSYQELIMSPKEIK